MTDIKMAIDENGRLDMVWENGDIATCENEEAVAVTIMEELLLERVEAIRSPLVDTNKDPQAGTDHYGTALDSSKPKIVAELEYKRVILGVPGVLSISEWNPSWPSSSKPGHTGTLSARVQTIYGAISINTAIGV